MGEMMIDCPECNEPVSPRATRCKCGWENPKFAKPETRPGQRALDPRCTYRHHADRCCYPVGLYSQGQSDGWCIFHRNMDVERTQEHGAEIVRDSLGHTRADYLERVEKLLNRKTQINPDLQKLADNTARVHAGIVEKFKFAKGLQ